MKKKVRKKNTMITPSIEMMIQEAVEKEEGTLKEIAKRFNVSLRSVCTIKAKYKKASEQIREEKKEKEKPQAKATGKKKKEKGQEYVLLPEHLKHKQEEEEVEEVTVEELTGQGNRISDAQKKTEKVLDSFLDVLMMRLEREKLYMMVHPTALRGPMEAKELIDGLKAAGQFVFRPLNPEDVNRGVKKLHNLFAEEYKKNKQHGKDN